MGIVRLVITMSLDGYTAGPDQSLDEPLGRRGQELHEWAVATRFFHEMIGKEGGTTGADDDQARAWATNLGAVIMGRNMFGPLRGPWPDDSWTGWWGPDPPYHTDVFVLTHHPRDPLPMDGGTTFHFVTDGVESALEQARAAADGKDVLIAGGADAGRQYLRAGLVDEMLIHVAPIFLCDGERLFERLDGEPDGFRCEEVASTPAATHYRFTRVG